MKLTDEAKEELDKTIKLRLKIAGLCIDTAHKILPKEYWDSMHEKEIRMIAERHGMKVVDKDYDPREDTNSQYRANNAE